MPITFIQMPTEKETKESRWKNSKRLPKCPKCGEYASWILEDMSVRDAISLCCTKHFIFYTPRTYIEFSYENGNIPDKVLRDCISKYKIAVKEMDARPY